MTSNTCTYIILIIVFALKNKRKGKGEDDTYKGKHEKITQHPKE